MDEFSTAEWATRDHRCARRAGRGRVRARWLAAAIIIGVSAQVTADSSVPSPPPLAGPWQDRCAARLRRAREELAAEQPAFSVGRVELERDPRGVRFEALVPDREHARFFAGKPARYLVRVVEKKSKAPGEIGADVGTPRGEQASVGFSRWSTQRFAKLDAQVVDGASAFRFRRVFEPAIDDCLRATATRSP